MKKVIFMTLILFCNFSPIAGHAAIIDTGKQADVEDAVTKDFIYHLLTPWTDHDLHDYYMKHYKAKSVEIEYPDMKDIRISLKAVITTPNPRYTHLVKIQIPKLKVKVDDKKEMIVVDTLLYAVNKDQITSYHNPNEMKKSVKLLDYNHKEITK